MVTLRYPVNALVSYFYFSKDNLREYTDGGLRLIGDSGAFSALTKGSPVDLHAFAEWAKKWRTNLAWVASLDVIGNAQGSLKNYERLRSMGIDVIPTVHYGTKPQELDFYARDGVDFVGLGGMVGPGSTTASLMRWCLSMMRYARDKYPQMRFHGWGLTAMEPVMKLPWWSIDSSSYGSAWRYGQMRLFDPRTAKFRSIRTDGKEAHGQGDFLQRYYGVNAAQISIVKDGTIELHGRISAKSYQYLEDFMARKFQLTPPVYGQFNPTTRQGVHVVDGAKRHLKSLARGER